MQAGTVVEPEACPLWLAIRDLEPFTAPDPFDALRVHFLAVAPGHRHDPTVAIAPVPESHRDNGGRQSGLVLDQDGDLALRRTMLAQNTASDAFGHTVLGNDVIDGAILSSLIPNSQESHG